MPAQPTLLWHLSQTLLPFTRKSFSVFRPHIWHRGTLPPHRSYSIAVNWLSIPSPDSTRSRSPGRTPTPCLTKSRTCGGEGWTARGASAGELPQLPTWSCWTARLDGASLLFQGNGDRGDGSWGRCAGGEAEARDDGERLASPLGAKNPAVQFLLAGPRYPVGAVALHTAYTTFRRTAFAGAGGFDRQLGLARVQRRELRNGKGPYRREPEELVRSWVWRMLSGLSDGPTVAVSGHTTLRPTISSWHLLRRALEWSWSRH